MSRAEAAVFLAAALVLAGCGGGAGPGPAGEAAPLKAARFHCPMHPSVVSDRPGDCPICNMRLVRMEESPEPAATGDERAPVRIATARLQLIGVATTEVAEAPFRKTIHAVGRVAVDETRLRHMHTKVGGYVGYLIAWAALWIGGLGILFLARDRLPGGIVQPLDELTWDKPPIPLIVDTDLSMVDHLALLFLLQHPGVDIQAIMVSGTGEVHCKPGVRNMLDILEMLGEPEIPVTCGRETPLSGDHAFPDSWREGADTLYGVELPAGTRQPYPGSAVDLIQSVLVEADQPVTLLTLGPLTNPGEALEAHPELAAEIERIYIMGGAVGVPGNVGPSTPEIDNQVAEWNICCPRSLPRSTTRLSPTASKTSQAFLGSAGQTQRLQGLAPSSGVTFGKRRKIPPSRRNLTPTTPRTVMC